MRWRWLLPRLLLLFASFGFCFFVAEVGLRVAGIGYPILVEPDPIAGARRRPHTKNWVSEEGRAFVEVNDRGYRDRVHPVAKPAGHFRVAFLGDSYTDAVQVMLEDTYWKIAEGLLRQCGALEGRTPEALNFGLSGIGTAQELEILRQVAWDYDPDFVVLAFVGNDIENNHPAFGGVGFKPFYRFSSDDPEALELDDSFLQSDGFRRRDSVGFRLVRSASDHSRVVQLVSELRRVLQRRAIASAMQQQAGAVGGGQLWNKAPETDLQRHAWRLTEALVVEVAKRVRERGRDFVLLAVSSPHQTHPDPEYRRKYAEATGIDEPFYLSRRLGRLAERNGIPYLDLNEPFLAHAEANDLCLHGFDNMLPCDGHWNEHGHRLAGELLAEAICRELAEE